MREISRRNTGALMPSTDGEPLLIERLDDIGSEDRLELVGVGVCMAEIAEYIADTGLRVRLLDAILHYRNEIPSSDLGAGDSGRLVCRFT